MRKRHACTVVFSVGRVSGYVGGGQKGAVEQAAVNVGFSFPSVDDGFRHQCAVEGAEQGFGIGQFAAAGIDEDRFAPQPVEEILAGQM